jgi:hypothetical protein
MPVESEYAALVVVEEAPGPSVPRGHSTMPDSSLVPKPDLGPGPERRSIQGQGQVLGSRLRHSAVELGQTPETPPVPQLEARMASAVLRTQITTTSDMEERVVVGLGSAHGRTGRGAGSLCPVDQTGLLCSLDASAMHSRRNSLVDLNGVQQDIWGLSGS